MKPWLEKSNSSPVMITDIFVEFSEKRTKKFDSLIHEMPFTRYGQIYLVSLAGTRRLIRSTQNLLPKHFIVILSYSDSFLVSFSLIISNSETSNQCYMMFCSRFGKLRLSARSYAYVSSVGHFFSGVSFLLSYWSTVGFSMFCNLFATLASYFPCLP